MTEINKNLEKEFMVDEDSLKSEEIKIRFEDKVIAKIVVISVDVMTRKEYLVKIRKILSNR